MNRKAGADQSAHSAFEHMASVYDLFAAEYEYEPWLRDLVRELEGHGLRRGGLLDVACGTGMSFLPMIENGWDVTGCDFSASMLRRAESKAPS
ncbi:MAG TPA: methyltransferase domain-containing protein, partial [Solirubrobacterales bacterium]